jgi:uncharacterized protein DUF2066
MRFHRAACAALIGFFLISGARGVLGAPEAFTVRGVLVDVTADAATAARDAAHAQGQVEAFGRLMARLLPRGELIGMQPVAPDRVVEFVSDFEVANERTSDVRYLAEITVRFNEDAVRRFLASNNLAHAETLSKPVVVVPVFGAAGAARLWAEENPWWAAWATRPPDGALVPLIVPLGDLGDIGTVNAGQALNGEMEPLNQLARRYGANDVLITQAIQQGDPALGPVTLQIGTSRFGRRQQNTTIETFIQGQEEDLLALYTRAAEVVAQDVQEDWKQRNLLRPGQALRVTVAVPVSGLDEWLKIQRSLSGVAGVARSEVVTLSRTHGELDISFVGNEQQLVLAMSQSDLDLSYDEAEGWLLRVAGAPTASAPASE